MRLDKSFTLAYPEFQRNLTKNEFFAREKCNEGSRSNVAKTRSFNARFQQRRGKWSQMHSLVNEHKFRVIFFISTVLEAGRNWSRRWMIRMYWSCATDPSGPRTIFQATSLLVAIQDSSNCLGCALKITRYNWPTDIILLQACLGRALDPCCSSAPSWISKRQMVAQNPQTEIDMSGIVWSTSKNFG